MALVISSLAVLTLAAIAGASRPLLLFSAAAALTGPAAYGLTKTWVRRPAVAKGGETR